MKYPKGNQMRKQLYFLLVLLPCISLGQDFSIVWDNTIGGSEPDLPKKIIETSDGNFICAGSSSSNISGDKSEDSNGNFDFWIVKVTPEGEVVWDATYGGEDRDMLFNGIETADHGFVFVGTSSSNTSGDKSEDCMGLADIWLIKLDSLGNLLWENTIGGDARDIGYDILETSDTGLLVIGASESNLSGDKTEASIGEYDFWIVRVNSAGDVIEDNVIGGTGNDHPNAALLNSDGSLLIYGTSSSGVSGDKTEVNRGGSDIWLVKVNDLGEVMWDKTYGGSGDDTDASFHIERTFEGGYIVATTSYSLADGDKIDFLRGESDFWIIKLNAEGEIIWQKGLGGNHLESATKIVSVETGGFLIAGYTLSGISFEKSEELKGDGWNDGWLVRLSESGDILWDYGIGGLHSDEIIDLVAYDNAFYLLSQSTSDIGFDKTEDAKGDLDYEDYWVLKVVLCEDLSDEVVFEDTALMAVQDGATYQWLDCDAGFSPIVGATSQFYTPVDAGNYAVRVTIGDCEVISACIYVGELGLSASGSLVFQYYPNPVDNFVFVSKPANTTITISSAAGIECLVSNAQKVDVRNLESGVYFIHLKDENGKIIVTQKMIKA